MCCNGFDVAGWGSTRGQLAGHIAAALFTEHEEEFRTPQDKNSGGALKWGGQVWSSG
jgi:hypothetical protein